MNNIIGVQLLQSFCDLLDEVYYLDFRQLGAPGATHMLEKCARVLLHDQIGVLIVFKEVYQVAEPLILLQSLQGLGLRHQIFSVEGVLGDFLENELIL